MNAAKYTMQASKNSEAGSKGVGIRREIRTQYDSVMLIRDVLRHTENPYYQSCIRAFGFDMNSFNQLLNGTHKVWASKPTYDGDYPADKPVEKITVRTDLTIDGKTIEATLVAPTAPSTMKARLPKTQGASICFEAILLQEGSITYDIAFGFNYNAGIYTAKGSFTSVKLKIGDLLIVPRGVAREVSEVAPGSKYLYIGDEWSKQDPPVEVVRVKPELRR